MQVWFSPHGTEWNAETYEEALEMERDALVEQYGEARQMAAAYEARRVETHRLLQQSEERAQAYKAERDGLLEQLQAAQQNLDKQTASMSAALTREVKAREGLQEQLESYEKTLTHIWEIAPLDLKSNLAAHALSMVKRPDLNQPTGGTR